MDKIPTTAEWVTIIEVIGEQCVQVEWAKALSGLTIGLSIFCAIFGIIAGALFTGKKLGIFD